MAKAGKSQKPPGLVTKKQTAKKPSSWGIGALVALGVGVGIAFAMPRYAKTLESPKAPAVETQQEQPLRKQENVSMEHPPRNEKPIATDAEAGREDLLPACPAWAYAGECEKNPQFMATSCLASCPDLQAPEAVTEPNDIPLDAAWPIPELRLELAKAQEEVNANPPWTLPGGACKDARKDCAQLALGNLSACGEAPFMLTECRKTCGTCHHGKLIGEVVGECKDTHEQCGEWARSGECHANRRFMLNGCSQACEVCEAKKMGCARRNTVPGLQAGDQMGAMFRRALSDFSQYEPQALNSDPYILQFENLVNQEEASALIARCEGRFDRSMAGDQISSVRTSSQCWCDDTEGCIDNPIVRRVTERMMNITQLPVENAEYFQILQYEPGQFYRAHHDQQTAHWTPQGVRVYTFFIYLSDVEAGGGTRFNDLGLVVTPKLGRAILWPSVREDDVIKGEMRTHHEALPVEKGIKYAANLWMHLYDFKTPSRAGLCPFLGQNTNG